MFLPPQVRHLEAIMRISEAFCKMRLSEYCTAVDIDRAIAVTVDSFVGSQKVSCKKALARAFAKYVFPFPFPRQRDRVRCGIVADSWVGTRSRGRARRSGRCRMGGAWGGARGGRWLWVLSRGARGGAGGEVGFVWFWTGVWGCVVHCRRIRAPLDRIEIAFSCVRVCESGSLCTSYQAG